MVSFNLQNNLKHFCLISQLVFINHSAMITDISYINKIMKKVYSSTTKTHEGYREEQQLN